ncbi:hypothetical protein P7M25_25850, partial [Vibrio parahaemolyticus]|nr:hypothetical protein [Vibrio parahaemolyticus]
MLIFKLLLVLVSIVVDTSVVVPIVSVHFPRRVTIVCWIVLLRANVIKVLSTCALRKKEQFQQKKYQSIKKPEDFIHEYRNKEVDLIRMKRRVKRKVPEANSNTMIIIRIQGKKDMHPRTRKVLFILWFSNHRDVHSVPPRRATA